MSRKNRCDACAVRHRSICAVMNATELAALQAMAQQKSVARGQWIVRAGEPAAHVANIVSGAVKLCRTDVDGRDTIVGLQFASDFLGRPFRRESVFDAVALSDVQLCLFPSGPFETLIKSHPGLERELYSRTLDELDAAREWMAVLGRQSAQQRLAALLVMMTDRSLAARCSGEDADEPVAFELPLSRQEIAEFLGLTIETVSRQFTLLKTDRVIALSGYRDVVVLAENDLRRRAA